MAYKTAATITYVDANNKKGTKSITDVNPSASNSAIKAFCVALNALSTNTISAIEKIERTDIFSIQTRTISLSPAKKNASQLPVTIQLTYDGAGQTATLSGKYPNNANVTQNVEDKTITFSLKDGAEQKGEVEGAPEQTFTITIPETSQYTDATATFTWTNINANGYTEF